MAVGGQPSLGVQGTRTREGFCLGDQGYKIPMNFTLLFSLVVIDCRPLKNGLMSYVKMI